MSSVQPEQLLSTDKTNIQSKGKLPETSQGLISSQSELTLNMSDEELIELKNKWIKEWDKYSKKVIKKQKKSEKYWLGTPNKQDDSDEGEDNVENDNLIFEALETFIPMSTSQRPDPVVYASGHSIQGEFQSQAEKLAKDVRQMLAFKADTMKLKILIKKVVRNWSLDLLGVVKHGWSEIEGDFKTVVLRATKLILDKNGTINHLGEYTGYYIGEYKEDTASTIALRFPEKRSVIKEAVQGKMGSTMRYIEWWTDDYLFWTMNEVVLDKVKNPHWNYPSNETKMDQYGFETPVKEKNHFKNRKIPYTFLSVFNIGKHPHDDTSLILQNIPNQETINRRNKQIETSVKRMNGNIVVSGETTGLNKEEAQVFAQNIADGGAGYIAQGDPRTAVASITFPSLPNDVYANRNDMRDELKNIFGVRGIQSSSVMKERTVRGKNQIAQIDASRMGNGIGEHIEQFVDNIYNWWVQMIYVYYDQPHSASVLGQDRSNEYITLKSDDMVSDLLVTVKEGSLLPKDEQSKVDQMKELATAGLIDPITLFDALNFSNPKESAKRLWLWNNAPQELFKNDQEVQSVIQKQAQVQKDKMAQDQQQSDIQHQQKLEQEIIKQQGNNQ